MLRKPFYKILDLYEEWADKLSISDSDLEYVFENEINYGIYLYKFHTIALVKKSDQYIPVAACVVDGIVASNQPVINTRGFSISYWEGTAYSCTKKIERIQFLPNVAKISNWDESEPTIVETELYKDSQKAAVHGGKPNKPPSFDELHKQGLLEPEDYNVEGNSIFNSGDLETHLHKFFRLRKNIDSWKPLKRDKVNEDELYFLSFSFSNGHLRVLHEERMRIEGLCDSNQDTAKELPQLQEHKKDKTQKTASNWYDITLTLLANNLIECSFEGGSLRKSLEEIGLAKQGNQEFTRPGGVLLGLFRGSKYPIPKHPIGPQRKNISKIRGALKELCGLDGNPFLPFNKDDGYKLKCKLIDNTKLSDQRAKERAIHVPLDDDTRPYKEEPDEGGGWLKEHDK